MEGERWAAAAETRAAERSSDLAVYYSVLMAKGMTTDVYPRDDCIAPDIAFIV